MKTDIILFFIDEHPKEERVYCQKLSLLSKEKTIDNIKFPNTSIVKNITLFSLNDMCEVKKLNTQELQLLKQYSTRTYNYN